MKILRIFIILFLVTSFSELKSDETNDIIKKFVGPINETIVEEIKKIIK